MTSENAAGADSDEARVGAKSVTSGDLEAALRSVWAGGDADSWQRLTKYARYRYFHMRFGESDADELAQGVVCKLFEKVRGGMAMPEVPVGYFSWMVKNFGVDEYRRRKRHRETVDTRADADRAMERPTTIDLHGFEPERSQEDVAREFDLWYRKLIAQATAGMQESAAERFRATANDVVALKAENVSMEELLAHEGVTPEAPLEEQKRVANRLQQRHKRVRDKLTEVVEAAKSIGEIDSETAWKWRQRLFLLRRRQNSEGPSVEESEGRAKSAPPTPAEETDHD